jgi:uncharacterized repeat protein (TIGR03803 family)
MDFRAVSFLPGSRPALRRLIVGSAALAAAAGFAPAQSTETVLHSFQGAPDGDTPVAGLIFDNEGALYGTTKFGGLSAFGPGVVFKLTPPVPPATKWTKTVLYRFQGGNDGANPFAGLVFNSNGALFGTTSGGGPFGFGTVFKLKPPVPPATQWTEKVLYSFGSPTAGSIFASKGPLSGTSNEKKCKSPPSLPSSPLGLLVIGSTVPGGLVDVAYGTTNMGGDCSKGAVFLLLAEVLPPVKGQIKGQIETQTQWTETTLYSFMDEPDGASPFAGLILDSKGALFGTTDTGGTSDNGTVFKLKPPVPPATAWTEKVLYNFNGGNDGAAPVAGLILDSEGALYGTTESGGGPSQAGTVFKLKPPVPPATTWTEKVLYSFTGGSDGALPQAGLIFDNQGALYGATFGGGTLGAGTVFKLNGALYGTTSGGGTANHGTVFKIQ